MNKTRINNNCDADQERDQLSDTAIICLDVCVEIPIVSSSNRSFKHALFKKMVGGAVAAKDGMVSVKALDGISFNAYPGDSIGILGHNGSGKTTLLKVLAGIYEPSRGSVNINGQTTPYFGLNEGITYEMTGLEAISIGALVRGVPYKEIAHVVHDVEVFTELGEFLSLPIRTYSTGMQARLLFAIATCIEPDILLVDENIGAGDSRFQEKVQMRVKDYISKARTFFLASHNPTMMEEWCSKGLLLRKGKLLFYGDISDAIEQYNNGHYLPEHSGGEDTE